MSLIGGTSYVLAADKESVTAGVATKVENGATFKWFYAFGGLLLAFVVALQVWQHNVVTIDANPEVNVTMQCASERVKLEVSEALEVKEL
jgi:hypothetical protein